MEALVQRRALDLHQVVDRHRLGLRVEARELRDQRGALATRFAHADDAAAADREPGVAHAVERVETVLVLARRDDLAVELRRGVEVVVVVVEAGVLERLGLAVLQHAERAAGLEPQRLDRAHHVEHRREVAILRPAPGRAHAEAGRACVLRGARRVDDDAQVQQRLADHARVIARGLRAIAAVLGTAAGLDRQQRGQLDRVGRVVFAMHLLRAEQQVVEWQREQGVDRIDVEPLPHGAGARRCRGCDGCGGFC